MAESAPWIFCQNNQVMLTYKHNQAPEILPWKCSSHRNKKTSHHDHPGLPSIITIWLITIYIHTLQSQPTAELTSSLPHLKSLEIISPQIISSNVISWIALVTYASYVSNFGYCVLLNQFCAAFLPILDTDLSLVSVLYQPLSQDVFMCQ